MQPSSALDNTVPKHGAVAQFWSEFCGAGGVPEATPYQAWHFGDSPRMAHELLELVLHGPKRATASALGANELQPQTAPQPDGYSVVTEYDGTPRAVVRTVQIDTRPLNQVDARFAWDEGEGDRTLDDWRDAHRRFFRRECEQAGRPFADDMPVALERFELLYPFDRALAVPDGPRIVPGYLPGTIGAVAALHARYYAEQHGFGSFFEAKVAREMAEFVARFDPMHDGLWLAVDRGRIEGSLVIDGSESDDGEHRTGHLRWFIIGDNLRGKGVGKRMIETAMAFCGRTGIRRTYLTTFAGLDAARSLYERAGFRLVHEARGRTWGRAATEQRFEWTR